MAKREFITIDNALDAVDERIKELKADKEFNIVKEICISGVRKHILDASTITEQEIVKPYLEKLKKEIKEMKTIDSARNWHIDRDRVIELIDNLLSEQEG